MAAAAGAAVPPRPPRPPPAAAGAAPPARIAGCGCGHGDCIDSAALLKINGAAIAVPLRLIAAEASARAAAPSPAGRARRRRRRIQPRHTRSIIADDVESRSRIGRRAGRRCCAGRAATGHERVIPAIRRRNHHGHRSGLIGHLLDAALQVVPVDFHFHRRRGRRSSASSSAAGRAGSARARRIVRRGRALLFRIDVATGRSLLHRFERDGVKLRAPATRGGSHSRHSHSAQHQQRFSVGRPLGAARSLELLRRNHALRAIGQVANPYVRAREIIALGVGQPLSVGRELRPGNIRSVVRDHHLGRSRIDVHLAQLPIRAVPIQRLRIGSPEHAALIAIRVAELLLRLAEFVGDPHFLAARAVGDKRDPLAVGRPARVLLAPGRIRHALRLAAIRGDGEDLAMHRDGPASVRRRQVERFGGIGNGHQRRIVFLGIALDIDRDLRGTARRHIQLPQPEVLFVDDGLSVGGDAREIEVARSVMRHLSGRAALIGDLPDVVDALHHLRAAVLDVLFVGRTVGNEIDLAARGVHGPQVVAFVIGVAELGELLGGYVHDPKVRRVSAAIMLARPDGGMPVEGQPRAIGRIAAVDAPVAGDGRFDAAIHGHFPQRGDRGERALAARGREQNLFAVGRPSHHRVVGRVEGKLPGLAARGGDRVDVVIPFAVRGERDRRAIRREARIDFARRVIGEPLDIGTVLVGDPDIAQVAESHLAFGIARIAQQLSLCLRKNGQ